MNWLWARARAYVAATAIVGVAAATAVVFQRLPHANNSLLFLMGVLLTAVRYGTWPSIYASVLSFFVYNFFFTPPFYTLTVGEEGDLATLVFFLVVAAITGNLTARTREAGRKREIAMRRTAALQDFTRSAAAAAGSDDVLRALAAHLARHFHASAVATVPVDAGGITVGCDLDGRALRGDDPQLAAGLGTSVAWTRWPIATSRGAHGTAAVHTARLDREDLDYAGSVVGQAAVAFDRTLLVRELEEAKLLSEREQLRASLLSSVSHDLRTPLASILGAASSLQAYEQTLGAPERAELLDTVLGETHRLDRYIQNLLDMTRLGYGAAEPERDWEDVRDLVAAAARRLRLKDAPRVRTVVAADAELVFVHGELVEQVLVNLLENALRYSPPGADIDVTARVAGDDVCIEVQDRGPGIPEAERERVFEPFYRVHDRDRKDGAGLGLSICRGIARAHGGDVTAHARPDGGSGTLLRLRLPRAEAGPHAEPDGEPDG